jgi:RNA 2',3'-cyclic 3'-phosphodiesterase
MARIRTFIAVELAPGVKERMTKLQESLGRSAEVKWVSLDNMHLTLLFLGEVEELDVVSICRVVQDRSRRFASFAIETQGLGAFPNSRRPKILWAGITEGIEELRALHADLEEGLLELGCYRREDRVYTPHLTLGRLKRDEGGEAWGPILAKHTTWQGGSSPVDEVVVMSSEQSRDGPHYSVMGRAPLARD